MSKEKTVVSVVVPVYHTEKYLDRCIRSIVTQTYPDLEIILVDDGSDDNCPQICDRWAEKDPRIRVIHKENEGLGMARNTGIAHATGKYICFFDSDDYIAPETVACACELAQAECADVVLFGISSVDARGNVTAVGVPQPGRSVYAGAQVQEELLPEMMGPDPRTGAVSNLSLSACRAMYLLELIRRADWRFVSEREILSEDIYSLLALYAHVRKAAVLKKSLYYYCENEVSLSRTYRPDRYSRNRHFYIKCQQLCGECGYSEKVMHRCAEPFLKNTIATMKQEVAHHDRRTAIARLRAIIDDAVLQNVLQEKRNDRINLKKRILFGAMRNGNYTICYFLLRAKMAAR